MNMDRLINMVINQVVRRVVNVVVDRGFRLVSRKTSAGPTQRTLDTPDQSSMHTDVVDAAKSRDLQDLAAKAAQTTRRIGR